MPLLDSAARFIAKSPGSTALIGAGLGAATNVGREALRSDGQPKNYLGSAIRGGVAGGVAGGALGLGGGAVRDTMLLNPQLRGAGNIAKATAQRAGTGISNMAQRQFHGLTGYGSGDKAYLGRIGISGNQAAANQARLLNLRATDDIEHLWKGWKPSGAKGAIANMADQGRRAAQEAKITDNLAAQVRGLHSHGEAGQRLMDLGMTSAPGAVKALATNPRAAAKAIWQQQTGGGGALGTGMAALGIGSSVYSGVKDIRKGDESAQGGRTVGEKAMRMGAGIGGNLLFGGLPMGAQMVAQPLLEAGAGRAGRTITRPQQIAPAQAAL